MEERWVLTQEGIQEEGKYVNPFTFSSFSHFSILENKISSPPCLENMKPHQALSKKPRMTTRPHIYGKILAIRDTRHLHTKRIKKGSYETHD